MIRVWITFLDFKTNFPHMFQLKGLFEVLFGWKTMNDEEQGTPRLSQVSFDFLMRLDCRNALVVF